MMKRLKQVLCWSWILFLSWTTISVAIDAYALGGKLKLLWIVLANTTSNSIYSTDGQSNIAIIIVAISGIIIAGTVFKHILFPEDDKKES